LLGNIGHHGAVTLVGPSVLATEEEVGALARQLAGWERRSPRAALHSAWWRDKAMARSMENPRFRAHLFRFVDTFPALSGSEDVTRHLSAEFDGVELPRWMAAGLAMSGGLPGGHAVLTAVTRRAITGMARQFIAGSDAKGVSDAVADMRRERTGAIVDLLGEHTHSEAEADRYAARLSELVRVMADEADGWETDALLDRDDSGDLPRVSVSIKVSALAPLFHPLTAEVGLDQATGRLLPILAACAERGVLCWFDLERYESKALTQKLFRQLLERPELVGLHAGIVLQAYLRDAESDLTSLAAWAEGRSIRPGVRLVKGAYWDTETIEAAAKGWPSPVFAHKADTDANYERLAGQLHDHHARLRAAFASHNLRSLARAVTEARRRDIPDNGYEIQLLYGMAEPVHEAIRRMGLRLRVYTPMGELVPGMAYLVRRLLENTANESFVQNHFAKGEALDVLLAPPAVTAEELPAATHTQSATYLPEPEAEWHRSDTERAYAEAVEAEFARPTRTIPAVIDGRRFQGVENLESVNPAQPASIVARAACSNAEDADAAVSGARRAFEDWRRVPAPERAAVLFRTAAHFRAHRTELAALCVREAGKPWAEADADVCEAIDFCEYYGREVVRLAEGGTVQSPPGEANSLTYRARGVAAVIAPWNFPLAIATGMTAAALVAGNAVVLKPAEQTPAVAYELYLALEAAGLPDGVCQFLPGSGEVAGAALVEHPGVDIIAFTGSRPVGLGIIESSGRVRDGRNSIPRVVVELGGKNAVIVCADADLDEVVPGVLSSAFSFSGQKCSAASRLICVEEVYDAVVHRVTEAARALIVGPPQNRATMVGPVIDEQSQARLAAVIARAGSMGTVLLRHPAGSSSDGFFVPVTIVGDVDPGSPLATTELFGPVLACFRVPDLDAALALANDGDHALTAAVYSRSPVDIARVTSELEAGNIYVNRATTGAVVGRQPFGGRRLSGGGTKAGGPDYLLSFCDPVTVTENTIRQGFAPD